MKVRENTNKYTRQIWKRQHCAKRYWAWDAWDYYIEKDCSFKLYSKTEKYWRFRFRDTPTIPFMLLYPQLYVMWVFLELDADIQRFYWFDAMAPCGCRTCTESREYDKHHHRHILRHKAATKDELKDMYDWSTKTYRYKYQEQSFSTPAKNITRDRAGNIIET